MSERPAGSSSSRLVLAGLLVVFLFALWLRLTGLDWMLPYIPEPDILPPMQLEAIEQHVPPDERLEYLRRYPYLVADLAYLVPAAEMPATDDLEEHLHAANSLILRVRWVNAVLSACLVLLTFRLARRFASPATALLAAAFVATSLLHLLFSQQARPHGIHATLAAVAMLAALRLREKPGWGIYIGAGLACGLAFASLQSGIATLLPLAAAHLLRDRTKGKAPFWRIAVSFAIVAALAYAFYPAHGQVRPEEVGHEFRLDLEAGGIRHRSHLIRFADLHGYGFVLVVRFLWEHDPALLVLSALGIVIALPTLARRVKDKDLLVVLAYVIPYLCACGIFSKTYERFLVPLLPYFALLSAAAVAACAGWIARAAPSVPARRATQSALACAALAFPTYAALKFASVRDAPDTVEQATRWIRENVRPEEGNIVVPPILTLPLFHDPALLQAGVPPYLYGSWVTYQLKLPPSTTRGPVYRLINIPPPLAVKNPEENPGLAEKMVEEWQPAYAVLEISRRVRVMKMMGPIYDALRARGERVFVASSEPEEDPLFRPLAHQDMPWMVQRLLGVECFGPRVEIWKLRRE